MAKGMREIKSKIKSTQNTKQITKAMEMVAASKLRRAQNAALASRPYSDKLKEVVSSIATSGSSVSHPMLESRPVKRSAYLVITSDRGQAGGLNSNLLKKLVEKLKEKHKSQDEFSLFVIGRKGYDYLVRRKYEIRQEIIGAPDSPTFADIKSIASAAVGGFENGEYDELFVVYNRFVNAVTQIPTIKQMLPLDASQFDKQDSSLSAGYEYEPDAEAILDVLLPKYAETLVFSSLLENKASEFGARMTAMSSATKNATKMINELTLHYNRARQAAITQEITEIVGGANAIS
ncbi:ATP synthase F1 subunit gamma [Cohnella thailandensis]|uniref:ATP synthase gamma chain n=1 Tax=Cohnella thailandensis TaxID=557557 RepID=A0A841T397_9BACL|nr:ATP synthase F1 subunit gamma [Cohnella thailandensis]MBB6638092.1 ATP synthase F1 subunit gamma [Cohnella thailandensis]MBP1971982.1 F-type H+-transporting ATPase subunit gamma [Cohnella thailandensis]